MPSLFSGLPAVRPPKLRSTMKAVTLSRPSTSVCANTVKISAHPPLEIQILDPLRMKLGAGQAAPERVGSGPRPRP